MTNSGIREKLLFEKINQLSAEIILLGGDLVAWNGDNQAAFEFLEKLKDRGGVYGVLGESDFQDTRLHAVLTGTFPVEEFLKRRRLRREMPPTQRPQSVEISNEESDFYTIVDVSANDRLGLLYDLTRTIAAEGLEIYISKAATIMDQVADTFYLKDEERNPVRDAAGVEKLRAALLRVLGESGG